jgi:hypothetical protein
MLIEMHMDAAPSTPSAPSGTPTSAPSGTTTSDGNIPADTSGWNSCARRRLVRVAA